MGVQGLNHFMENWCPDTCIKVDLRKMAVDHMTAHPGSTPTLVVDGMACVRQWYSCQAWVHGGQWKEYMHILNEFVSAFSAAGIKLVFYFDGVVEERKRAEWVRRRLRSNKDIAKIFHLIKSDGQQPGRDISLPSGLATFSRFALKSLGQETKCSTREGDYEIATYANSHNYMGILGQDSDFVIYDTVPYLSASKLCLQSMTTVLFSRERLCHALGLEKTDLPLIACLLGNDVVPETCMRHVRDRAINEYRNRHGRHQGEKVFAVAEFISSCHPLRDGSGGIASLSLSVADTQLLENGMHSYVLPGQRFPWTNQELCDTGSVCAMERFVDAAILKAAKEKHTRAECFMIYNILYDGVVECSNTLEDEENTELPSQASVFQPIREHIYGLLLPTQPDHAVPVPAVKEWFVFPGNKLKEPKMVSPKQFSDSDIKPDLRDLWFRKDTEVRHLQLSTFLALLELKEYAEVLDTLEVPLVAVVCLVTYIVLQVTHLSLEDVDAYLSQAVCVRFKTYTDLCHTKVPCVDPRAVQLGSLFVRGLTYLVTANSACGSPFSMEDLMPWRMFDGLLFHQKYLLAHSGRPSEELLEGNSSWISQFYSLRELVLNTCRRRGRTIQTAPRRTQQEPDSRDCL
ncbi:constitutive coactivator of peroxisome proliferator-activated receptor gamma isoform X2 [Clupea harengus]|uniref:Constitutive coactivator of peroxisome proliferator-activated receptor gamma isoform X2 n=1 Tax=Clupea harengus TaxID=7950 RepID=A0A8M1KNL0_CLUHA|nr:constitutive coactivator of peroxisome proliferator-activated receptor gamma isoform X2 [Clupea harengus]